MAERSIPYKSIFMRCDVIDKSACLELPSFLELVHYQPGMEADWARIQKHAGEFADKSEEQVSAFFLEQFGGEQYLSALQERCLFLREKETGNMVGTCMAWFACKGEERIPLLHWLAVDAACGGRGYARMLVTQVLRRFEELGEGQRIYLHTQPSSYRAIKLYNDFGFCMVREDTFGTRVNEYEGAMEVLKEYMTEASYDKLVRTSVL